MNRESQCTQILKYLRSGRTLTKLEALRKFHSWHAGARILDLRIDGWPIRTQMIRTRTGKRVARYSLQ